MAGEDTKIPGQGSDGKPPGGGEKPPGDGKPQTVAIDSPEYKKLTEDSGKLQSVLEENGCDTVEELLGLVNTGRQVKGLVQNVDEIKHLRERAKRLDKIEAYWESRKEADARKNEEPDQTIARLEKKLERERNSRLSVEQEKEETEAAKKALESYNKTVKDYVGTLDDVPAKAKPLLELFMGVDNPFNEVDISDPHAVKRMAKQLSKKWGDLQKIIIDDYLAKKKDPPPITPGAGSTGSPTDANKPKIKLKEARAMLGERISAMYGPKS